MAVHKLPGEHVYRGMVLADTMSPTSLQAVEDFEYRSDDVLVDTYPKAGTTWIEHIVWLLNNNVDIETARIIPLHKRSCFLEHDLADATYMEEIYKLKTPRTLKSHLPYSFFKKAIENQGGAGFKTVVQMRNVKDLLVSFYHFYRMNGKLGYFKGEFDEFFSLFKEKHLLYGDYFDHVLGWWEKRQHPNVYIIKYEDMKKDLRGEIIKVASFLGRTLTAPQLDTIIKESTFESMQKDPMANNSTLDFFKDDISKFMRKGQVGDWKNYFSEEQNEYVNGLIEKELTPKGLVFQEI